MSSFNLEIVVGCARIGYKKRKSYTAGSFASIMFFENDFDSWTPGEEAFPYDELTPSLTIGTPMTAKTTFDEPDEPLNPPLADDYYNASSQNPSTRIGSSDISEHQRPLVSSSSSSSSAVNTVFSAPTKSTNLKKTRHSDNKSLGNVFSEIESLCDRLNLASRIVNEAQRLATRHALCSADSSSTRNQRMSAFTAAYVFAACRQEKAPRSFVQISRASGVTIHQLSRRLRHIASITIVGANLQRARAVDYLPRLCAEAGYPFKIEREARDLLLARGFNESSQIAQAVGALFHVCGEESLKTIIAVSGVCPKTVQRHCSALNLQIPKADLL